MKYLIGFLKSNWLQHLAFWSLSLYGIGSYFSISNFLKFIDFIYSGFFHIPLLLLVYINIRLLVPRFLGQQKYLSFGFLSLLNLILAYAVHELVFNYIIPMASQEFYLVSFTEPTVLFAIFTVYLLLSTLLKISHSWYALQEVEKEKLSLELNALKMQINPHFLFNSLNSIYALSLKKSDKTPSSILELSALMRYMIYELADDTVPMQTELDALEHYIKLQKLRLDPDVDVKFEKHIDDERAAIAPLLFLPLVENSFKHGLKSNQGNFVHIYLSLDKGDLHFEISNNKSETEDPEKGKFGGIGLENVRKRLALIYPEKADLRISESEEEFKVELGIRGNA
ncbi:MAG: histidine kinase [Bacteroidetes bacterium]|nr:histidine kinase [Bacteroidota bacterium]